MSVILTFFISLTFSKNLYKSYSHHFFKLSTNDLRLFYAIVEQVHLCLAQKMIRHLCCNLKKVITVGIS